MVWWRIETKQEERVDDSDDTICDGDSGSSTLGGGP